MMTTQPRLLPLALAGLLAFPLAATAQAQASEDHSAHPPESGQPAAPAGTASVQDLRQAMRARMAEIRATQDPERRRQLLEAQMQDMEAMLEAGACPLPGGGMMGGRSGQAMMSGMMGQGMQQCMMGGMGGRGMQQGMAGQAGRGGMGCAMMGRGMPQGMGGPDRAGAEVTGRLEALEKRVDLIQMLLERQARQVDRP